MCSQRLHGETKIHGQTGWLGPHGVSGSVNAAWHLAREEARSRARRQTGLGSSAPVSLWERVA